MGYHLLIQSAPHTAKCQLAIQQTQALIASGASIKQIFFYFQGIDQVFDMTLAKEWDRLVQAKSLLKVCSTAVEKTGTKTLPPGFVLSSLIDFFATHWQDQGVLLQF